ncbi:MAG: methyl-accepting chemotaxis protein, partial [Treponema sp.]|nr:methyl-accepting chemotaxis protein [Treponema sp.]
EQNEGSRQITGALHAMNDSAEEVRTSSSEMAQGNRTIFGEMGLLQKAALEMCSSMDEMSANAQKIRETGSALSSVSAHIKFSISKIGEQVDQFRA